MDIMPSYRKFPAEDNYSKKPPIKLPKSEKKGRNKDSTVAPKDRSKFNKAYKEFTKSMHEKVSIFDTKTSFSEMYKTSMKNWDKYSKFEENDSFWSRQKKYLTLKVKRQEKLKSAKSQKELSECTFAPRTGSKSHKNGNKGK